MRIATTVFALSLAVSAAAGAQTPQPAAVPTTAASPLPGGPTAEPCEPREANLAGIGRASVVAFTGAIFRERVCATVANVALDAFEARTIDPSAAAAPATPGAGVPFADAVLGDGGSVTFALAGASVSGVGPYVVEPGGRFPSLNGDTAAQPRVVLAYAGARLLLIATTPVALADLARVLRDQPDLFGADAVERAVVLASGPSATLSLQTDEGTFGQAAAGARRVLEFTKRS
ncbi:MAG: hypothetical protein ABI186_11380 [Candidatus Elarobacter sp.]